MGGIAWFFRKHRGEAFATNRRLLHVQTLSHDPMLGDEEFQSLTSPQEVV